MRKGLGAAEIIAKALEYWGSRGERWTKGMLVNKQTGAVCAYGGLSTAAFSIKGQPFGCYEIKVGNPLWDHPNREGFNRACKLMRDNVPLGSTIIIFNDTQPSFQPVKELACKSLKQALAEEE